MGTPATRIVITLIAATVSVTVRTMWSPRALPVRMAWCATVRRPARRVCAPRARRLPVAVRPTPSATTTMSVTESRLVSATLACWVRRWFATMACSATEWKPAIRCRAASRARRFPIAARPTRSVMTTMSVTESKLVSATLACWARRWIATTLIPARTTAAIHWAVA